MSKGCGCKSDYGCVPVGPIGEKGPKGDPGTNGTNGVSVIAQFVSDGITPIGDVIYPINTLILQFSDLTYFNAGVITTATIQWQNITTQNGWVNGAGVLAAQYAIFAGFLHLRGRIDFSAASSDAFATIPATGITGTLYTSGATDHAGVDLELDQEAIITINNTGSISALGASTTLDGSRLILDTIPPISIR